MKIVVIGGGAAGFFAAIHAAAGGKNEVVLLEKTSKLLQKVKVSGGERCNVTNSCTDMKQLCLNYPRGDKQLRSAFTKFSTTDTIKWFEDRKVKLKTEPDGRMFPASDSSQTIIDCLIKEANKNKVTIETETEVKEIIPSFHGGFDVFLKNSTRIFCDKVIVATGGSPKEESLLWLKSLGHEIIEPVPSLFTFNIPDNPIVELMGLSVDPAKVRIPDAKLEYSGPVLITHWGLSGPAILKLSSFGARKLADRDYDFSIQINWLNEKKEDALRQELFNIKAANPTKQVGKLLPFKLPARLTKFLLDKSSIDESKNWAEVSKEEINKLAQNILFDTYHVLGKTTFKEEFVTCGGVSLNDVDFKSMQSKKVKGLHFAGEVLDIDGLTGGFNFQAAWTTGYIAGMAAGAI
jgi:predicted Rossmann fold flavoprotein